MQFSRGFSLKQLPTTSHHSVDKGHVCAVLLLRLSCRSYARFAARLAGHLALLLPAARIYIFCDLLDAPFHAAHNNTHIRVYRTGHMTCDARQGRVINAEACLLAAQLRQGERGSGVGGLTLRPVMSVVVVVWWLSAVLDFQTVRLVVRDYGNSNT